MTCSLEYISFAYGKHDRQDFNKNAKFATFNWQTPNNPFFKVNRQFSVLIFNSKPFYIVQNSLLFKVSDIIRG